MQLLILLASVVTQVMALRGAPAPAVASSPMATPASPAPPPSEMQQVAQVPDNKTANNTGLKDIDRKPDNYDNDTLSEEAFDAAEPHFADLDCLKRDSVITINEAATFGVKNGVPWSEIKSIFEALDADKDGSISKAEFNTNKTLHQKFLEDLRTGFKDIDLDGDNLISSKEWMAFCNGWMTPHPTEKVCNALFKAADTLAPKGEIDRSEFEHAGKQCHSIDDGDCEQPTKGTLLQAGSRKSQSLAEIVRRSAPRTGEGLFALLVRRHHKH